MEAKPRKILLEVGASRRGLGYVLGLLATATGIANTVMWWVQPWMIKRLGARLTLCVAMASTVLRCWLYTIATIGKGWSQPPAAKRQQRLVLVKTGKRVLEHHADKDILTVTCTVEERQRPHRHGFWRM